MKVSQSHTEIHRATQRKNLRESPCHLSALRVTKTVTHKNKTSCNKKKELHRDSQSHTEIHRATQRKNLRESPCHLSALREIRK